MFRCDNESCLECPLELCVYDNPGTGRKGKENRERKEELEREFKKLWKKSCGSGKSYIGR